MAHCCCKRHTRLSATHLQDPHQRAVFLEVNISEAMVSEHQQPQLHVFTDLIFVLKNLLAGPLSVHKGNWSICLFPQSHSSGEALLLPTFSPAWKGLQMPVLQEQLQHRPEAPQVPTGSSRASEFDVSNSPWTGGEAKRSLAGRGCEEPEKMPRQLCPTVPSTPKPVRPRTQFPSLGWADATRELSWVQRLALGRDCFSRHSASVLVIGVRAFNQGNGEITKGERN